MFRLFAHARYGRGYGKHPFLVHASEYLRVLTAAEASPGSALGDRGEVDEAETSTGDSRPGLGSCYGTAEKTEKRKWQKGQIGQKVWREWALLGPTRGL